MVNNVERIRRELKKEANRTAAKEGLDGDTVFSVIMKIVDLEHQNRLKKSPTIDKTVADMIEKLSNSTT